MTWEPAGRSAEYFSRGGLSFLHPGRFGSILLIVTAAARASPAPKSWGRMDRFIAAILAVGDYLNIMRRNNVGGSRRRGRTGEHEREAVRGVELRGQGPAHLGRERARQRQAEPEMRATGAGRLLAPETIEK